MTTYVGSLTEKKDGGEFLTGYVVVKDVLGFMKDVPPEVVGQVQQILEPYKTYVQLKSGRRQQVGQYGETHTLAINEMNAGTNNVQGTGQPVQQAPAQQAPAPAGTQAFGAQPPAQFPGQAPAQAPPVQPAPPPQPQPATAPVQNYAQAAAPPTPQAYSAPQPGAQQSATPGAVGNVPVPSLNSQMPAQAPAPQGNPNGGGGFQ